MARLTKDPEVSSSASGTTFARFSIAVDRRFKRDGEPDADFFNCSAFGKIAEFIEKYGKKGTKFLISGRLENNDYTNKDGQKVRDNRIIIEEIEFAESKKESNNTDSRDVAEFNHIDISELPFS